MYNGKKYLNGKVQALLSRFKETVDKMFNDRKQEGKRLNCIAVQSSTVNVTW